MSIRAVRLWRVLALILAFGLIAAACGDDDDDGDTGGDEGGEETGDDTGDETGDGEGEGAEGAAFEQVDLSGIDITVGSKDFTEQLVLGEMLVDAFEAAGADVTNQVDLGGTVVNREALLAGEIDVYAEYNGTGWTVHLERDYEEVAGEDGTVESDALTEAVREADREENGIVWLGQSPFNDTYGFASRPDLLDDGEPFTMQSMADYLAENPDATVCMESEFPVRPDGLVLFEEATGFEIPEDQQEILDTGIIYTETEAGSCDFGEVFTTDGRIGGLGLNLVEDPGIMIIYNVSVNVREEVYEQAPEAFDTIADELLAGLDQETMTELNRRVDIDGIPADEVAQTYLQEQGLIS